MRPSEDSFGGEANRTVLEGEVYGTRKGGKGCSANRCDFIWVMAIGGAAMDTHVRRGTEGRARFNIDIVEVGDFVRVEDSEVVIEDGSDTVDM